MNLAPTPNCGPFPIQAIFLCEFRPSTGNDRYSGDRYSGIDRYSGTKTHDDAILFTVSGITALVELLNEMRD